MAVRLADWPAQTVAVDGVLLMEGFATMVTVIALVLLMVPEATVSEMVCTPAVA